MLHSSSMLLTPEENITVHSKLGNRCHCLAMGVVQVFASKGSDWDASWEYQSTGALCLVKDNPMRSFFFRLYYPPTGDVIWEHEIYNNLEYREVTYYFHSFEGENCIVGFNFALEDEAKMFRQALIDKMEERKQKKLERRSRRMNSMRKPDYFNEGRTSPPPPPPPAQLTPSPHSLNDNPAPDRQNKKTLRKKKNKMDGKSTLRRKKLHKADIGQPTDFKHVSHLGWSKEKGFAASNIHDERVIAFLKELGVPDSQLNTKGTWDFIKQFIADNGGMEALTRDLNGRSGSTRPDRPLPQPPPIEPPQPPPIPRSNSQYDDYNSHCYEEVGSPPPTTPPPPLPPMIDGHPTPTMGSPSVKRQGRPPSSPSTKRQAPVPPPPMPKSPPPPPPPSNPSAPPPPPPPPSNLSGPPPPPPPPSNANRPPPPPQPQRQTPADSQHQPEDSRSALLSDIRKGVVLKKVAPGNTVKGIQPLVGTVGLKTASNVQPGKGPAGGEGIAAALARALQERNKAIMGDHGPEDDDDDDDDSDEEWQD